MFHAFEGWTGANDAVALVTTLAHAGLFLGELAFVTYHVPTPGQRLK